MNAGKGEPELDVCRTYLMLKAPSTVQNRLYRCIANPIKCLLAHTYLKAYTNQTGLPQRKILKWTKAVAKHRLTEGVLPLESKWWNKMATKQPQ